jgi:CubicO group peptidase (beta-lactamase class C family)
MEYAMSAPEPLMLLPSAFERQDYRFASAFSVLEEAIRERAFPAASVAATFEGRLIALKAFGHFTYQYDSPAVTSDTLFDLASLTKVVATTSLAMRLYERGLLDLDATVAAIVPEFVSHPEKDSRRRDVTLGMLLSHSSGLPAYEKLFLKARTREEYCTQSSRCRLLPIRDPAPTIATSDLFFSASPSDASLTSLSTLLAKLKSSPRSA